MQGGVENADLQFHTLVNGQDGIMFSPGEGTGNVIKNVFITHLTATTVSAAAASCSGSCLGGVIGRALQRNVCILGALPRQSHYVIPTCLAACLGRKLLPHLNCIQHSMS